MDNSLEPLFSPRSVAVIGASRKRGSVGSEIFHNIVRCGFRGPVYPVHPHADSVQSVRAYPSVRDIPDPVELAVVVVPAAQVEAVVEECVAKGVKGIVVISAGYAELGADGKARQQRLVAEVREAGIRMVGPNCLGLLNTDPAVSLNATFAPTWPPEGSVAFSSQSGALGLAILDYAHELGIGISEFVSVGNKADVSGNDLLEHWEHAEATDVILLYLESFGNPRRFMEIAKRVSRKKPIVVVKSGRTEAGARAASSHTGSLAGLDVAVDALLGQAGVMRTDTLEELFDMAMLLANQPVPRGNRVAILTNAGGPGIMASDACASRGLELPPLSESTAAELRSFLPAAASVSNPVDMIASASAEAYEKALRLVLADANVDAVIVLFVPPVVTEASAVAEAICRGAEANEKPVLTCFMGSHGIPAALSSLRERRFPSYAFPEAVAIALARAVRYGQWLQQPEGIVPHFPVDPETVRSQTGLGETVSEHWLSAASIRALFDGYGIPMVRTEFCASSEDAVAAAERLGFPVALKLASERIVHKTDVGGVQLDLRDAQAVRDAYARIERNLGAAGAPEAMQGVVVQQMIPEGQEIFIGVTHDPAFGPLIGFGIGGINVEVWRDVAFRVHPITDRDAWSMLSEIKGRALLEGYRGAPAVDKHAIVDMLLRISQMVGDLPEIAELDINPLMARAAAVGGAVVVDARVRACCPR